MHFEEVMANIAKGFEALGVAILIVGAVFAFARAGVRLVQRQAAGIYVELRNSLGRTILLGLEILVAADLIRTVAVDPSLANVGALALIVAIRTVLSFSLEIEIDGRLPWRRSQPAGRVASAGAAAD